MKPLYAILAIALLACQAAWAQSVRVPFLDEQPVIDGKPDRAVLAQTTAVPLAVEEKSNSANPDHHVRFRMAYGTAFLYFCVEVDADSVTCRDRAYQNGDGFHLTIARPAPDFAPTDEFYVLRFSPGTGPLQENARLGVWYYNIDLQGRRLSPAAQLKTSSSHGTTYFEAVIPWSDIHPYHPFAGPIGFNFCFVKAIGSAEKNYYFLTADDRMQSEGQKRRYCMIEFVPPSRAISRMQSVLFLTRNTIASTGSDTVLVSCLSPRNAKLSVHLQMCDAKGMVHFSEKFARTVQRGMNRIALALPPAALAVGSYSVRCTLGSDSTNAAHLTVLPKTDFEEIAGRITRQTMVREGTRTTLLFLAERLRERTRMIKAYEDGTALREETEALQAMVHETERGVDLFMEKRGVFRRAFRSAIDSTLRPYTVKIPRSLDTLKRYPLLVFLHGSGEDDAEALSHTSLSEGDWIELAPNGRGVSNCFTTDHAQEDIDEAIADAMKNYPIDTSRIVIAGFSMGGYGAYRTFYAHPGRYCGVAVFSGHPNLASRWIGDGHPDFLDAAYLPSFKNIPMFIYHNENDRNCPYELTEALIEKLKAAGAALDVVITKDGGHSLVDDQSKAKYFSWLRERAGTHSHTDE